MDEDLLWILDEKANHNETSVEELVWLLDEKANHNEVSLEELWPATEPHYHNQVAGERR
ncbi:hypothetical protein [Kutzneria sp. NPDC052558]|uniref:hypothetical protein n=1 Tax=Kutzneria sp. NPDC052558 TaxID=3364121 RepID=UPI0037C7201B